MGLLARRLFVGLLLAVIACGGAAGVRGDGSDAGEGEDGCSAQQSVCSTSCVDTQSDPSHCLVRLGRGYGACNDPANTAFVR